MFEIERFCADCRLAMKETDQERAARDVVARGEWDPDRYEEMAREVGKNAGLFELSNRRMEELKRGAAR